MPGCTSTGLSSTNTSIRLSGGFGVTAFDNEAFCVNYIFIFKNHNENDD